MCLTQHLESYLGQITEGLSVSEAGQGMPIILPFRNQPIKGATTYVTLGCSNVTLHQEDGSAIRQELLMISYDGYDQMEIVALISSVYLEDMLATGSALTHRSVLGPAGPIIDGSQLTAFYCARPAYFPDGFHRFTETDPIVEFLWLVPITDREAKYVKKNGSDAFEYLLVEQDPDLMNLSRTGIV